MLPSLVRAAEEQAAVQTEPAAVAAEQTVAWRSQSTPTDQTFVTVFLSGVGTLAASLLCMCGVADWWKLLAKGS